VRVEALAEEGNGIDSDVGAEDAPATEPPAAE